MLAGSDCYAQDNAGKPLAETTSEAEATSALKVLQDVQLSFWNRCTRGNQVYQKGDYKQAFGLFSEALTISEHKDMVRALPLYVAANANKVTHFSRGMMERVIELEQFLLIALYV